MDTDNRNVDFATKYAKSLNQAFSESSLTDKYVTHENSFKEDGGVASVYFRTVDTSDFLEGHTGPVFSDPTSVKSDVVRKDVELFYQINKVIASVDTDDTAGAMSAAGEILSTGIREQYAPLTDKLNIATAIAAARSYGGKNVVSYTSGKIMEGIDSMIATLKNVRSYSRTQALFIPASYEAELDSSLFSIYAPNKNDSVISTGVIGKYKGIDVVILPDELFCTMATTGTGQYKKAAFTTDGTIRAILWDKRVMKTCRKLYKTFVLTGKAAITAGADGPVLRGLFRPGAWAIDANGTNKAVAVLTTGGGESES
ncbi:hypothetical protein IJI55_00865 [Candidatus Saccharibacteria bacterium]|nr:hypothetical protein [Candidatus Saccharibacteria bacterium]